MSSKKFRYETLRETAFGSITAGYVKMGGSFENAITKVVLNNDTDAKVYFSFNGSDAHHKLPAYTGWTVDITMDSDNPDFTQKGSFIYVKHDGGAPSVGSVFVTATYGR